jgi:hypothetical protein
MSGVEILALDLAERLQSVEVLAIEIVLTEAKLDAIVELAKPGRSYSASLSTRSFQ